MALLQRDDVDLYYELHGDGPAILLTHGYSATSQMWRGQIEALSTEHTLITWDMRGHGRSGSPEDPACYSEAHTVRDMAALLDHNGFESAVIGGLSLGGYMSLAFNVAEPDRVRGLLIIDTGPGYNSDRGRQAWNKTAIAMAVTLEEQGLTALANRGVEMATAQHESARGLALAARGMLTQHKSSVIQSLPEIRVPSLVLLGANDEAFLKSSDYMADKIPGATKVVIADAGHAANIDQPEKFNVAVVEFLAANKL
ncbi:MAG: alpha/beta fold hydrolase [Gammaproteobacteria bacterium]|nr:alpha/beta fold hydrolase [Gammaproteobacteria bacterium]